MNTYYRRALGVLVAALLAAIGVVTSGSTATAATVRASELPYNTYDDAELFPVGRTVDGLQARIWCNYGYDPAERPDEEHVWRGSDGYPDHHQNFSSGDLAAFAARIVVDVPDPLYDEVHYVDLSGACGFARFWIDGQTAAAPVGWSSLVSSDGLGLDVDMARSGATSGDPDDHGGDGGTIFGETTSGELYPIYLQTYVVSGTAPPFEPETGEPTPEPEPEPEPTPEPEPEPTPDPPVVDVPEDPADPPAVPEVPEGIAPPVVDEPVVPFAPQTGIEDGAPSVSTWLGIAFSVVAGASLVRLYFVSRRGGGQE